MAIRSLLVLLLAALVPALVHGGRRANPEFTSIDAVEQVEAPEPSPEMTPRRAGRMAAAGKRRAGLAAVLPFLVARAAPTVEAFSRLGLGAAGAGAPAGLPRRLDGARDSAAGVGEIALGMAPKENPFGDVTTIWPQHWLEVLETPKVVSLNKHSEVFKCQSRPEYGEFEVGVTMFDIMPGYPDQTEYLIREVEKMKEFSARSMIEVMDVRAAVSSNGGHVQILVLQEPVDGTLRERVFDQPWSAVSFKDRIQISCDILRGLRRLHRENNIHRSITPEDVFVMRSAIDEGRLHAKLGNLGNALSSSDVKRWAEKGGSFLFGDRPYIAPELWLGKYASSKSDIFAAGIIMYQLFLGRLPAFYLQERFRNVPKSLENDPLGPAVVREFKIRQDPGLQVLRRTDPDIASLITIMLYRNQLLRPSADTALRRAKEIALRRSVVITPQAVARLPSPAQRALLLKK